MSNIVLSAGIRSNLLALQQNSSDQDVVNKALSTGKKVNTALDDPLKYFTAQNFDNRGSELGALLDNIGLGINTLTQANSGITALSNTIQTLQAQLRNALQNTSTNAKLASTSNLANGQLLNWGPDSSGNSPWLLTTGAPATSAPGPFVAGAVLTITATNQQYPTVGSVTIAPNIGTAGFVTAANVVAANYPHALPDTINTIQKLVDFINASSANVDPDTSKLNAPLVHASIDAGGRLIVENLSGTPTNTLVGPTAGQLSLKLTGTGVTAAVNDGGTNLHSLFGRFSDSITPFTAAPPATPPYAGADTDLENITSTLNTTRSTAAATYNSSLLQITNIAKDAGYNGTNLLYGDTLNLILNEFNTTNLVVTGVILDSTGLNLKKQDTQYNLQSDTEINAALTKLQNAYTTLQAQAASFATNNTIATNRQQFTKNTIKTLTDGSDLLVLADQNEEGASLLALQTRQQLSTQALSLANQSDKAVLRLFN